MANTIESDKIFIKSIFEMWYRIPEYQRPYVWESDQINDLLDDISFAQQQNKDSEYFLGSIVFQKKLIKNNDGAEYIENDLLDGQQRLTTLFLLTAVIRDITENTTRRTTCQKSIFQEANPDDNIPERLRIVFDIRNEVRDFIDIYIKEVDGTKNEKLNELAMNSKDLSIRNMATAILEMHKYFKNNEISIDDFFPYFRNKVLMIYVASEELEDAFKLFTIMNNRGIKLRNSDILKAMNLREVGDDTKRNIYAKKWESIENYFEEDFDVFLSHLRTILVKDKARLNLLDEFEKNIYGPSKYDRETKTYTKLLPLLIKGEETFKYIDKYKQYYVELFDNSHYDEYSSYKLDNLLTVMQATLPADFWISPLLRFYDKFKKDRLLEFLKKLDNKFSYDWIIQLTPTTRIENMTKIISKIDSIQNINDLFTSDVFDINENDLINILKEDIYGRRFTRYVLYKLDYLYSSKDEKMNIPKTISVEHILPQNPKNESQWKKDFTDIQIENNKHKIGNLVLISRSKNSSQGNLDYDKKKEKYFQKNIDLFRNSIRVLTQNDTWTLEKLQKNQENVIKELCTYYS
jgi:uncharacterized protein with ParB-like and HNH nuclease domain